MRVISQDGLYDLPYEALAIRFHENDGTIILGVPLSVVSMDLVSDVPLITLGIYSTEAKAKKAMETLRQKYNDIYFISITGNSNEFKIAASLLTQSSFDEVTNPYFQFPADEDVEV